MQQEDDVLNKIRNAVDSLYLEVSAKVQLPMATLLLTIDDVRPHIPLETLRQITSNDAALSTLLRLEEGGLPFDEALAKKFFSSTGWRPANAVGSTAYGDLTPSAKRFVKWLEAETGVPVTLIGTGPKGAHIIDLRERCK